VTNEGSFVYDRIGDINLLPIKMYYNTESIVIVFSLKAVSTIPGVRITMDTSFDRSITVLLDDERSLVFIECADGLYFYGIAQQDNDTNHQVSD